MAHGFHPSLQLEWTVVLGISLYAMGEASKSSLHLKTVALLSFTMISLYNLSCTGCAQWWDLLHPECSWALSYWSRRDKWWFDFLGGYSTESQYLDNTKDWRSNQCTLNSWKSILHRHCNKIPKPTGNVTSVMMTLIKKISISLMIHDHLRPWNLCTLQLNTRIYKKDPGNERETQRHWSEQPRNTKQQILRLLYCSPPFCHQSQQATPLIHNKCRSPRGGSLI